MSFDYERGWIAGHVTAAVVLLLGWLVLIAMDQPFRPGVWIGVLFLRSVVEMWRAKRMRERAA